MSRKKNGRGGSASCRSEAQISVFVIIQLYAWCRDRVVLGRLAAAGSVPTGAGQKSRPAAHKEARKLVFVKGRKQKGRREGEGGEKGEEGREGKWECEDNGSVKITGV